MKIKRLLLSSSVLLMTTLGLAGCASSTNKSASSDSSSKETTSKVTESRKSSAKAKDSTNSALACRSDIVLFTVEVVTKKSL